MDEIIYQDQIFNSREINLQEFGIVTISTISLRNKLLTEEFGYTSREAQIIDEQIFFFVEDEEINLSDKELRSLIIEAVC